jgi:hypothetical protein
MASRRLCPSHLLGLASLSAAAACASTPLQGPRATDPIAGAENLRASIVVMGEVHGTVEAPRTFEHLVRASHPPGSKRPVLVGLEIPENQQPALDTFMRSDGGPESVAKLLEDPEGRFWRRDFQDGRSSRAMLELLQALRLHQASGAPLTVLAFDTDTAPSAQERDASMASTIESAIARVQPARTWILVGNVHSQTIAGAAWDPAQVHLGVHLASRHPDLLALDVRAESGAAWTCPSDDPKACGASDGGRPLRPEGPPRIELWPAPSKADPEAGIMEAGHHGAVRIARTHASPPAVTDNATTTSP